MSPTDRADASWPAAGGGVRSPVTPRPHRRRWRSRILAGSLVVAVLAVAVLTALSSAASGSPLDPTSPAPAGGQALALLVTQLTGEPVAILQTPRLPRSRGPATVLTPQPDDLAPSTLRGLAAAAAAGDTVVLVAPDAATRRRLGLSLRTTPVGPRRSPPDCTLRAADVAGAVLAGPEGYSGHLAGARSCYRGWLLVIRRGLGEIVLLGGPDAFENAELARAGDAALGVGLLAAHPQLLWLGPGAALPAPAGRPRSLLTLLPTAVQAGLVGLALAGLAFGASRAHRFGGVVLEPLPVVVRAAEVLEGRARLYAAGRRRREVADALRGGCRSRLARRFDLPGLAEVDRDLLVERTAQATGRSAAAVGELLYGAPRDPVPADDAGLLRLAGKLDALTAEAGARPPAAVPARVAHP